MGGGVSGTEGTCCSLSAVNGDWGGGGAVAMGLGTTAYGDWGVCSGLPLDMGYGDCACCLAGEYSLSVGDDGRVAVGLNGD